MQLVRGLHNLRRAHRGATIAIGNFDGVHRGHQAIVACAREHARTLGVPALAMTFEPHPREYFDPSGAPARLMRVTDKAAALASHGIDATLVMRFDRRLQQLDGRQFIDVVLCRSLAARHVVIGDGFVFGRGRSGDVALLEQVGREAGFGVSVVPPFTLDGERVSSTAVRGRLAAGDLDGAARLLGAPYAICGRVIRGRQLGRELGYPTANLRLHRQRVPLSGIFAVRVSGHGLDGAPAVASLGTRPMVGGVEPLLEVHVFDYSGDLYGRRLRIEFHRKLRDEAVFDDLAAMVRQMDADSRAARAALGDRDRLAPA